MSDPTRRFSNRVENYIRYRPDYPAAIVETLRANCRLRPGALMADIGSGTGKLARLFLEHGQRVIGVEPNPEMRQAGRRLLQAYDGFTSLDSTAEATGLGSGSVDFVTVGQALHWFKLDPARAEFGRIVKPDGWVVLVWNSRRTGSTPFLQAYERLLLTYSADYQTVGHMKLAVDPADAFFKHDAFELVTFENNQQFDFEGVKGRLLSSSYAPAAGQPNHEPMLAELETIFQRYQLGGKISFEYDTHLYYGRLTNK